MSWQEEGRRPAHAFAVDAEWADDVAGAAVSATSVRSAGLVGGFAVKSPQIPYLTHIRIDSFGAMGGHTVGPLSRGLNVLYGRNEAGKTTVSSFVGGVLFGWEEARGQRNTYKPENAERAGALVFADDEGGQFELSRVRNIDGLQGDAWLAADIDKSTFKTMFSLNSDELRQLRNASEVTAKLLTAGSGTDASPAQALAELQGRLAEFTSRAASAEKSLVRMGAERDELRGQLREVAAEMEAYREQCRELQELEAGRAELLAQLDALNEQMENLSACVAGIEKLDAELRRLRLECEDLHDEEIRALADKKNAERTVGRKLARLTPAEDRTLRDKLDELSAAAARLDHAEDAARSSYEDARAAYEARAGVAVADGCEHASMLEAASELVVSGVDEVGGAGADVRFATSSATAASGRSEGIACENPADSASDATSAASTSRKIAPRSPALLFAFAAASVVAAVGAAYFAWQSQSAAIGIAAGVLAVCACVLAVGGVAALRFASRASASPSAAEAAKQAAIESSRFAMLQSQRKLANIAASKAQLREEISAALADVGLEQAQGSLRRAYALLDEAKDARTEIALCEQRQRSASARVDSVERYIEQAATQRAALLTNAQLPDSATAFDVEAAMARTSKRRDAAQAQLAQLSKRYGELKQALAHAAKRRDFDQLKVRNQAVRTKMSDATQDLVRTLLAKRMLEQAIAEWEVQSQPQVYAHASRLLATMTNGAWARVSLGGDGRLQVENGAKVKRDPLHLSLGTCQQLYLSMRLALLMVADNVGRSIPVLADDILVNFDEQRRIGAAQALNELAEHRQILLFTCHRGVADLFPEANFIEL